MECTVVIGLSAASEADNLSLPFLFCLSSLFPVCPLFPSSVSVSVVFLCLGLAGAIGRHTASESRVQSLELGVSSLNWRNVNLTTS